MENIGFDFGTTNSTLSYVDPDSGRLNCFKLNASDGEYSPTVISYGKNNRISIGEEAKMDLTEPGKDAYDNFKLGLISDFDKPIPNRDKTPGELAHDYIKTILDRYKEATKIAPKKIVMTIPERCFYDKSNTVKKYIETIWSDIGYRNIQLHSEPIAATAYYCWKYQEENKKPYKGSVLVVDYGGGTLDVTLCMVTESGSIRPLERFDGKYDNTNGCAGVAFDEAVISILLKEKGQSLERSDRKFILLRNDFEKKKIAKTAQISEEMQEYFRNKEVYSQDEPELFTITVEEIKLEVHCKHLDEAFDKANREALESSLKQMSERFSAQGVDPASHETFQVLLIGGFSNFWSVQNYVQGHFSNVLKKNPRFNDLLTRENRTLAIAKGAAVIANGTIVEEVCTHDIGIILGKYNSNGAWEDQYIRLITKGESLSNLEKLKYGISVQVWGNDGPVRLYIGSDRKPFEIKGGVQELLKAETYPASFKLGVAVDGNLDMTLYVQAPSGKETSKYLTNLNNC